MERQYQRNLKMITNIIVTIVLVLLCIFALPKLIIYFMPFVIGWIIACIANPLVQFLESKLKIKRKAGTVVVSALVVGAVIGVAYLIVSILIRQLQGYIASIPAMWDAIQSDFSSVRLVINRLFHDINPNWDNALNTAGEMISQYMKALPSKLESVSFEDVGSVVGSVANAIISVIMCLLSAYFFISERDYVYRLLKKLIPSSVKRRYGVIYKSLLQAVGGYFKAQLKIEIWIYLLMLIGLLVLKVDYAFLIAFAVAVLDFFPVFGTGVVFWPWTILKVLSGDYVRAIGFVIIWGVGQLVRQLIQPKIMGDSIGMAPIPTLILLYVGYKVSGVAGMIFAVPIGIIVVNMNNAGLFDTPKNSIKILLANLNRYRRLDESDLQIIQDSPKQTSNEEE